MLKAVIFYYWPSGCSPKPGLRDAGCNATHTAPAVLLAYHERLTSVRNGAAS